jgi:hypothetical protein
MFHPGKTPGLPIKGGAGVSFINIPDSKISSINIRLELSNLYDLSSSA